MPLWNARWSGIEWEEKMHMKIQWLVAFITFSITVSSADGQLMTIDPFVGDESENFDENSAGFYGELGIFIGLPEGARGGEPNGLMIPAFLTSSSTFLGSQILARSAPHFSHVTGPVEFVFFSPIRQFGAYVATNSGADGGLVEFFDADDALIGTMPLDVTFITGIAEYTWNGWESDIGFSRVRITSNGVLEGFLGFDDMEMSTVPAPGASLLLLLAAGAKRRRRQR